MRDAAARAAVGDGDDGEFTQTAWGADVEYSRDYYLVRVESDRQRVAAAGRSARRRSTRR